MSTATATATSAFPGPTTPRPLQAMRFFRDPFGYFQQMQAEYGDMFRVSIADEKPWIVLSDPDHIKQVFTGSPAVYHAGKANSVLLPLLGDHSVLLLDGAQHLRQRKLLLPAFHGERMASYGDVMREAAEREVAKWRVGEELRLAPRLQDVTLEVIMRAVFGMRDGAEMDELSRRLVKLLDQVMRPRTFVALGLLGPRRFRELAYVKKQLAPADESLFAEFARRRQATDLAERDDILSLLMQATDEDGNPMTDVELRDELMTLLVAGHETTATSLSWTIERLIRHPDVLQKLRDDLEAGSDAYLDAVIKEVLRLRPVLPVVVRDVQEDVEIGGRAIPKGSRIACSITLMHRNPEIYPDPEAFRPERFLDTQPGTYTWIPFGGGIRRCLGASFALFEMKQVLPAIIEQLELAPVDPSDERIARRLITLTPGSRAHVRVVSRRSASRTEPVTVTA
ncbi:MAG: cytochrome P450 [Solirubrobacteraceae bacterium]|nr:cytochrome P450 [Solirubrobacteraceae bacterium]